MTGTSTVGADPVVALLREGADPRALYYLWEQQQWEAGKLQLAVDAQQWGEVDPALRRPAADSVAWRRLRAEVATTALVPFVDVAPDEEQQVFLTTQLVDEARHLVFFDRFQSEVAGASGEHLQDRGGLVDQTPLRSLLTEVVPGLGREVARGTTAHLVSAVTIYNIATLGALGLTEQRALVAHLRDEDVLPGLCEGLELEARSAIRHVAFGLGFVAALVSDQPLLRAAVARGLSRSWPLVRDGLVAVASVAPLPYDATSLVGDAQRRLEGWFAEVGLELSVES